MPQMAMVGVGSSASAHTYKHTSLAGAAPSGGLWHFGCAAWCKQRPLFVPILVFGYLIRGLQSPPELFPVSDV